MSGGSATGGRAEAAGVARGPLPLVLLPGHMCDARMWGPQVAALSSSRTIHLPRDARANSMEEMASIVLAEAPPRFALAGLSMGGILAMEVLRQAPHRVERLALLDTNPLPEAPEVARDRMARMGRVAAGDLDAVVTCEMKPLYLAAVTRMGPRRADILDLCLDMARSLGPDAFLHQSRALIDRPDGQATLAAYRGPALVLMGAEDRLCPRDRHELMVSLMPQATFAVIEGAGHLPPLEQPGATNAALRRWLEDDDAPPQARPRDAGAPARRGHADGVQRGRGGGGPARLRPLH